MIQCSLYCYAEDKTESTIIISLENGSDTYFWKAHGINRYLKAYSNWWPLTLDVTIPPKELKSGSMLKVYVWNNDSPEVYIDNFRINIFDIKVL